MVESSRQVKCKCHGLSGSCDVRTCWRALPNHFRSIGSSIKHLYDVATVLPSSTVGVSHRQRRRQRHSSTAPGDDGPSVVDGGLVYSRRSTDWRRWRCRLDNARGIVPGVTGSVCAVGDDTAGRATCDRVCCGRPFYVRRLIVVDQRCRCQFHYCCHVTCEPCEKTVTQLVCT